MEDMIALFLGQIAHDFQQNTCLELLLAGVER